MEITVIPLARLRSPSSAHIAGRVPDFFALMKPRVMLLAVFTALVGLMIAPGHLDPPSDSLQFLESPQAPVPPVCLTCGTTPISMP